MKPKQILRALRHPAFLRDLLRYRSMARSLGQSVPPLAKIRPIANEATSTTGFDTHYVYHTGWAARVLARTRPAMHVDIGSSLYFVANVSAFQPMIHYDYRPPALALPGVAVGGADLLNLAFADASIASLSSMHVVEHVGLGRYGDRLDPAGDARACAELARVLAPGGQLLFVTPVGRPALYFNAHRIYGFDQVMAMFPGLDLAEFALITDKRDGATFLPDADPARVARQRYGCGCFLFRKAG